MHNVSIRASERITFASLGVGRLTVPAAIRSSIDEVSDGLGTDVVDDDEAGQLVLMVAGTAGRRRRRLLCTPEPALLYRRYRRGYRFGPLIGPTAGIMR